MNPNYPYRHSTRLTGFDYGQDAAFFVSLVVENRQPLFGRIIDAEVQLFAIGEIIKREWLRTPSVRPGIFIDEWVIMPDHFQAIVFIHQDRHRGTIGDMRSVGAHRSAPVIPHEIPLQRQSRTLGSMIGQFKSVTTTQINRIRRTPGVPVWQRNYHDRIIRNEVELDKIRRYIRNNPRQK